MRTTKEGRAAYMRDYRAKQRGGLPTKRSRPPLTIDSFRARTLENAIGCWIWQGNSGGGYGHVQFDGRLTTAHRAAWIVVNGPIAPGLVVRHYWCGNPPCINPGHMALGTQAENLADRARDIHQGCQRRTT